MLARFLSSEVAAFKVVASPLLSEFLASVFIAVWYSPVRHFQKPWTRFLLR
jgi:hypothetical protein